MSTKNAIRNGRQSVGTPPFASERGVGGKASPTPARRRVLQGLTRDHGVGRVRDDSAEDTGEVTSGGGNTELLDLVVLRLGLAEGVVDGGDGGLERPELHHGVRDLTSPERRERLEEPVRGIQDQQLAARKRHSRENSRAGALSGDDLVGTRDGARGERREGGLHADLDGLHGDEGHVGEEFGRGGTGKEDGVLVLDGVLRTSEVRVELLEELVEAVLGGSLHRVTDQGRGETGVETAEAALAGVDLFPSVHVGLVQVLVDLLAALDKVERGDKGVGGTARDGTAEGASSVVLARVELDGLRVDLRGSLGSTCIANMWSAVRSRRKKQKENW